MKSKMKKVMALICAIAMIVSSITAYDNTAKAAVTDLPESGTGVWISVNNFGTGDVIFIAGLQTFSGALSYNLYVDGKMWGKVTNGARIETSKFTPGTHDFIVTALDTNGEFGRSKVFALTIPGSTETTTVKPVETTTKKLVETTTAKPVETTTEKPVETTTAKPAETTTAKPVETTTAKPAETTTAKSEGGQNRATYAAAYDWMKVGFLPSEKAGRGQFRAVCGSGDINEIVNIQQPGGATEPGIYVSFKDGDIGEITVNGVSLKGYIEGAGVVMYLPNFEYMYSDVVVKNLAGSVKAVIYVNNFTGVNNSKDAIGSTTTETTPAKPAETTAKPTETTKKPEETTPVKLGETTTVKPVETTTVKSVETTSATQVQTTEAPTDVKNNIGAAKVNAPKKTKITKASKKKAAKKISITFKKVAGVKGYQIAVYKTAKNAKANKKAIVKKFAKSVKIVINSKKFKKVSALYVRVRAYKLGNDGKTKVYGQWSNVKKTK